MDDDEIFVQFFFAFKVLLLKKLSASAVYDCYAVILLL